MITPSARVVKTSIVQSALSKWRANNGFQNVDCNYFLNFLLKPTYGKGLTTVVHTFERWALILL